MEREKFEKVLALVKEDDVESLKELVIGEDFFVVSMIFRYAAGIKAVKTVTWLLLEEPQLRNSYALENSDDKAIKEKFKKILSLVKEDDVESLKELLCEENSYTASVILCYAAEVNAIETVKWLLKEPNVMPQLQNNYALRIAAAKGHDEIKKLLQLDNRVDYRVLENKNLKIEITDMESVMDNMLKSNIIELKKYIEHIKKKINEETGISFDNHSSKEDAKVPVADDYESGEDEKVPVDDGYMSEEIVDVAVVEEVLKESIDTAEDTNTEEVNNDEDISAECQKMEMTDDIPKKMSITMDDIVIPEFLKKSNWQ